MKNHKLITALVAALLLGGGSSWAQSSQPKERPMRDFMQQKLDYASGVLEGITLERYHRVITNAVQLRNMTLTNVTLALAMNVNYQAQVTNFQASVDEVITAARANDLEKTTEAYMKMTRSCVECHKWFRRDQFVRSQLQRH